MNAINEPIRQHESSQETSNKILPFDEITWYNFYFLLQNKYFPFVSSKILNILAKNNQINMMMHCLLFPVSDRFYDAYIKYSWFQIWVLQRHAVVKREKQGALVSYWFECFYYLHDFGLTLKRISVWKHIRSVLLGTRCFFY